MNTTPRSVVSESDATSSTTIPHPSIPMPAWASNRYVDSYSGDIIDEHVYDDGIFSITFDRHHCPKGDGYQDTDDNVVVEWASVWQSGGRDAEYFCVLVRDLPDLIAVLQRAYEAVQSRERVLRRPAEVDEQLREVEN